MKQMSYQLKRLVSSSDKHIELKEDMPEDIDVLETTHLLIKVNTLNKLSPARVTVTYGPGQVVPKKETKEMKKMT
jgi:hypothetical protein